MTFTKEHQKMVLIALVAAIVLINGYRFLNKDKPQTAPLVYERGAVAASPIRQGILARTGGADPLSIFLERREERFPGVARDIFRMENPIPKPKTAPTPTIVVAPPPVPVRTPEEIAADAARADLGRFRYLGYLTEKDNTLFLSKDGELFIVKSGDKILKTYKVKEANKDSVTLYDTATRVEVRIDLAGDVAQAPGQVSPLQAQPPRSPGLQPSQPMFQPGPQNSPAPGQQMQALPQQQPDMAPQEGLPSGGRPLRRRLVNQKKLDSKVGTQEP